MGWKPETHFFSCTACLLQIPDLFGFFAIIDEIASDLWVTQGGSSEELDLHGGCFLGKWNPSQFAIIWHAWLWLGWGLQQVFFMPSEITSAFLRHKEQGKWRSGPKMNSQELPICCSDSPEYISVIVSSTVESEAILIVIIKNRVWVWVMGSSHI